MIKTILQKSIEYIKHNHKIVRLTLATSFFHSLIASLLIILNINTLFARNYENGLYVGKITEFFVQEINSNHVINRVIGIAILLFIAYSIIYPIGQAAIIHYINDDNKSIRSALKKWKEDFFPMFEFWILSLFFSPTVYWLTVIKIAVSGHQFTSTSLFFLVLRFVGMSVINSLKIHTRYIITIERKWVYDAVIKSCILTLKNFKTSTKYARIQTTLLINYSINLLIIYILPIMLIYLAIVFNIIQYPSIKWTVYGILFWGIIFWAYATAIVRAFFAYFRQEIYDTLPKDLSSYGKETTII